MAFTSLSLAILAYTFCVSLLTLVLPLEFYTISRNCCRVRATLRLTLLMFQLVSNILVKSLFLLFTVIMFILLLALNFLFCFFINSFSVIPQSTSHSSVSLIGFVVKSQPGPRSPVLQQT